MELNAFVTEVKALAVGPAAATFFSCNAAPLTFTFTRGSNARESGTINLLRVGPTPADYGP